MNIKNKSIAKEFVHLFRIQLSEYQEQKKITHKFVEYLEGCVLLKDTIIQSKDTMVQSKNTMVGLKSTTVQPMSITTE